MIYYFLDYVDKLICFFRGHDWDNRHGFQEAGDFGAICYRCGKINETEAEWLAKISDRRHD